MHQVQGPLDDSRVLTTLRGCVTAILPFFVYPALSSICNPEPGLYQRAKSSQLSRNCEAFRLVVTSRQQELHDTCDIWVVFPDPVSPITTVMGLSSTARRISSACAVMGSCTPPLRVIEAAATRLRLQGRPRTRANCVALHSQATMSIKWSFNPLFASLLVLVLNWH